MDTKIIGHGIECNVFDVGDNIVYKKYDRNTHISKSKQNKHARAAFELQCIAADAGIAPAAISYDGGIGYYSEKVRIFEELDGAERETFRKGVEELVSKIDELFEGNFGDDHNGNFGIKDDGTMCIIDFGLAGFSRTSVGTRIEKECGLE